MDLETLKTEVVSFGKERNWDKFHTPKELAIKLVLESCELLELFEWLGPEEVEKILEDEDFKLALEDEFADVFRTLLQLSEKCDVNLLEAMKKKHEESKKRFPLEKSKDLDVFEWKLKKIKGHKKVKA